MTPPAAGHPPAADSYPFRKGDEQMRTSYGYDVYRGRSKLRTALLVVAVLLSLFLVASVAFFFLAQPYVVYNDDGSVRFDFPWAAHAETTPSPVPTPDEDIVIVVTPEPTPEPTPTPVTTLLSLPLSALDDGTAAAQADAAGADGVVFTMKAPDGTLGYASQNPMALHAKVSSEADGRNGAIEALTAGELYTVARVTCFLDDTIPYYYGRNTGLRTGNGNWRGAEGSRWLSPASETARGYLAALCAELAGLGFDEIWLDVCAFPTQGRLANITRNEAYDPAALTPAVEEFYSLIRETLADYPEVRLALTAEKGALLSDPEDQSGQTLELLSAYADLVYLPQAGEGEDYSAALEALGFPEDRVIYFGEGDLPQTVSRVLP